MTFESAHPRTPAGQPGGGKFAAKGSSGAEVQNTQTALNHSDVSGTKQLKVDGQFGDKTEARVKEFQRHANIQVDGVVGPQTSAALRRRVGWVNAHPRNQRLSLSADLTLDATVFTADKHPRDWKGRWKKVLATVQVPNRAGPDELKATRAKILAVIDEGQKRATQVAQNSRDHGPKHWRDVAHMGLQQIKAGVPADADVLLTFAALHDTQRWDEWSDPEHGPRAAVVAQQLRDEGKLDYLNDGQFKQLKDALTLHNGAPGDSDTTVGAALDADRYTLWRVGTEPDFRFMSAHKNGHLSEPEMQELKAYGKQLTAGPGYDWPTVLDQWHLVRSHPDPADVEAAKAAEAEKAPPAAGFNEHVDRIKSFLGDVADVKLERHGTEAHQQQLTIVPKLTGPNAEVADDYQMAITPGLGGSAGKAYFEDASGEGRLHPDAWAAAQEARKHVDAVRRQLNPEPSMAWIQRRGRAARAHNERLHRGGM